MAYPGAAIRDGELLVWTIFGSGLNVPNLYYILKRPQIGLLLTLLE